MTGLRLELSLKPAQISQQVQSFIVVLLLCMQDAASLLPLSGHLVYIESLLTVKPNLKLILFCFTMDFISFDN